ncbi:MAG: bifunctional proline dehydrogenase/L-glutamate gamma-semialdehyde dehydrogenase [Planctomycetia bacterium]|nr:bifunctional proline dehydrogenase/L-glutamate gamma-semialdehyde dehydrogenase [Planctomycetia bacterium]
MPTETRSPASAALISHQQLRATIAALQVDSRSTLSPQVQRAIALARLLQERAGQLQTPQERRQQAELDRLIQNPHDKATLIEMTDQAFRCEAARRTADQLTHILDVQGVPRFFSPLERMMLRGFQSFGNYLPGVAVPLVKERMHRETANVILPAERELLSPYLEERRQAGVRMNVNYLGESLLGEREARQRLENYLAALQLPEIEVISVKISTLYSQISALARAHTIDTLCDVLEVLYRAAAEARFVRADGSRVPKFVYLDMEEYRDMSITTAAFINTLSRPGLRHAQAGIALQAYIPDSLATQCEINAWARQRVAEGGAPVTIRIVKGANLEMERVEASLHSWPQAPFKTKAETDANYKRMLLEAMRPENLAAVRVGVASHNLFDLGYAMVLAADADGLDRVQFEMLEGLANHQRRALLEQTHSLLLYAPACRREQFLNAIGYLVRRLDENTGPDNFLRHAFRLQVDSEDWRRLEADFARSFEAVGQLSDRPRRTQDRNRVIEEVVTTPCQAISFTNEPDTDWSLPQNSQWAESIIDSWINLHGNAAIEIPLVVAGQERHEGRTVRECLDPSRPGVVVARYRQAAANDVEQAIAAARQDSAGWRTMPSGDRAVIMRAAAVELRRARADLMGAALANGGKTLSESDSEVSEAIDFVEFYTETAEYFQSLPGLRASPAGVVVVVSPWNFPIAIPCGGVAAALAAGNTVILKPASDAVLVAYELCRCFWRAGVSQQALQLVPCSGGDVGQKLVSHDDVNTVILTGGTSTAEAMLRHKPELHLLAETGGKNATIVTALSDREQAVKNVIHSAFSHSGQKCSATSLLILEDEVYEDAGFRELLCDAVESLRVGSVWELPTRIGPLIGPPTGSLQSALTDLLPGETWGVQPRISTDNPNLVSPGVKWGVTPGGVTHMTEFFGPLLGVMRARNLDEAIALANATGYGLTAGLESLDDREQRQWRETIRAGNLYINRPTTGAIVLRQPFGGIGKSAFGPGIKAGGPNYVAQLMTFNSEYPVLSTEYSVLGTQYSVPGAQLADPLLAELRESLANLLLASGNFSGLDHVIEAISSYDDGFREEFGREHDHFLLLGQDNVRRYLKVRDLRIRVDSADTLFDTFARVAAARTVGCRMTVSTPLGLHSPALSLLETLTHDWAGAIEFVEETDTQLREVILRRQTDRVRYAAADRVPRAIRTASAETGIYIADAPVLGHGRVELLWSVQEQSISFSYHRYGNLGARAEEPRAETQ